MSSTDAQVNPSETQEISDAVVVKSTDSTVVPSETAKKVKAAVKTVIDGSIRRLHAVPFFIVRMFPAANFEPTKNSIETHVISGEVVSSTDPYRKESPVGLLKHCISPVLECFAALNAESITFVAKDVKESDKILDSLLSLFKKTIATELETVSVTTVEGVSQEQPSTTSVVNWRVSPKTDEHDQINFGFYAITANSEVKARPIARSTIAKIKSKFEHLDVSPIFGYVVDVTTLTDLTTVSFLKNLHEEGWSAYTYADLLANEHELLWVPPKEQLSQFMSETSVLNVTD